MAPTVGAAGVGGCASITTSADNGDVHPAASVTVQLQVPAARPFIVAVVVLPAIPPGLIVQLPAGKLVNTTDPVATAHVGCVIVPTVSAAGVGGCALITTSADNGDVHPAALVTVQL